MSWLPHDLGTWGLILSVVTFFLAIPLGIVGTLLAPRVRVWWFLRSIKGTANKLVSLTAYHKQLSREPLFSPTETMLFEQQFRLMNALHLLAYILILSVVFVTQWKPHPTFSESMLMSRRFVAPFVILILGSWTYFGWKALDCLVRSSPKQRKKTEEQIDELVEKLRKASPPV